jgi:hypothetical protein
MSTLETILSHAMSEPKFAEQLFKNPEEALADYTLTAEEHTQLKNMSRAEFEVLATEQRKSMVLNDGRSYVTGHFTLDLDGMA